MQDVGAKDAYFIMSNYILEGDSYFVLQRLNQLTENKTVSINETKNYEFSLFSVPDFVVHFEPDKDLMESISSENFILCFLDKNLDQRLDYVKKLKQKATLECFDPIPSTDAQSLSSLFPKMPVEYLPTKKVPLKYKGSKQNYEWFDLCLIDDLFDFGPDVFKQVFEGCFDIWRFTEDLWSGNAKCLNQIDSINDKNFEDYFNRIRETSKDYIEVVQTQARSFYEHKKLLPQTAITNDFRFMKTKEKNDRLKDPLLCLGYIDACLKNVREGSNPKLELIRLFNRFKANVKQ